MPAYPRPILALFASVAAACAPSPAGSTHDCDLSQPHVVVGTIDAHYAVGALAAYTADGCVADRLSSTSGDAVVRSTSERVWVLNRTGGDAILGYGHGVYDVPELELGAYRMDNPHDLVRVGDQLFLSLYERDELVVLDAADGSEVGRVDLGPYADEDGVPEADALVVKDGAVFVALQRLDRRNDLWMPAGDGKVLRIDPDSLAVDGEWDVSTNPKMTTFDGEIVVMSGAYSEADGLLEVLRTDMPEGSQVETVFTEEELQLDLGGGAAGVVLGTAFEKGGDSTIGCIDGSSWTTATTSASWFPEAVDARGQGRGVVVAARKGWEGPGAGGLWSVDHERCEATDLGVDLLLDPYSLAVVP